MNILIFSTVFYPSIGGIENHTLLLIENFIQNGHQVKVITYQKQKEKIKEFEVYYRPNPILSLKLFFWSTVLYMPNISLKGIWLMLFNPYKTWVISHNDFSSLNKSGMISLLKNWANRLASKNIAVSPSVGKYIPHHLEIIPNGYDEHVFKLYPEEQREIDFVFLGRLVSQKGADLLIRACAELDKDFSLVLLGDGPEKSTLMELTKQLNLDSEITFKGFVRGETLVKFLNKCKYMVIPSLDDEGFGLVALEGLACGCKIIAADAGGLKDAVGVYGNLFPKNDIDALVHLMRKALRNELQSKADDSDALNQYLAKHSGSKVAASYLNYFN